jgi:hypothetical protein
MRAPQRLGRAERPGGNVLRSVGIVSYWVSVVMSALAEIGFLFAEKLSRSRTQE